MTFSSNELIELPRIISAARFATYLQASENNPKVALSLYQWNLEISAAFLIPLQLCEVAIRNGVAEAIEMVHGSNWPWSEGFRRSLPRPVDPRQYNPASNLAAIAAKHRTVGKVIADLNFAFWEKLFTAGQDARIWRPHMSTVFPNIPLEAEASTSSIQKARATAFHDLQNIRRFRNRIAHHEPIFSRSLEVDYARLRTLISWRSQAAARWMERQQKVTILIALRETDKDKA